MNQKSQIIICLYMIFQISLCFNSCQNAIGTWEGTIKDTKNNCAYNIETLYISGNSTNLLFVGGGSINNCSQKSGININIEATCVDGRLIMPSGLAVGDFNTLSWVEFHSGSTWIYDITKAKNTECFKALGNYEGTYGASDMTGHCFDILKDVTVSGNPENVVVSGTQIGHNCTTGTKQFTYKGYCVQPGFLVFDYGRAYINSTVLSFDTFRGQQSGAGIALKRKGYGFAFGKTQPSYILWKNFQQGHDGITERVYEEFQF